MDPSGANHAGPGTARLGDSTDEQAASGETARAWPLFDSGDDDLAALTPAITRRLDEMAEGQVLEIVSALPDLGGDLGAWCGQSGHDLLDSTQVEGTGSFRMRRAAKPAAGIAPHTTANTNTMKGTGE